jgi:hypothetical protein
VQPLRYSAGRAVILLSEVLQTYVPAALCLFGLWFGERDGYKRGYAKGVASWSGSSSR